MLVERHLKSLKSNTKKNMEYKQEYKQEDIELAAKWSLEAHKGQVDKAGKPYFMHPFFVCMQVQKPVEQIVALLHDVLEDSEAISPVDILNQFGQEVFDAVVAITRGIEETYNDYLKRLVTNEIARVVKIADIKHNLMNRLFDIPESLRNRYERALAFLENYDIYKKYGKI